jgi:hypothetical protein
MYYSSINAKAEACFIPLLRWLAQQLYPRVSNFILAMFPMDFMFGANNLNPNVIRNKNGIPYSEKNISSPKDQIG